MAKDEEKKCVLKKERIEYWLSVGAQPTETVASILKKNNIALKS
jgi:small subunit ribosomal protein S16